MRTFRRREVLTASAALVQIVEQLDALERAGDKVQPLVEVQRERAPRFAGALARGQPEGGRIALTTFRDEMSELL